MDYARKNIVALGLVILMAEYAFVFCDGIRWTKYHYNGNTGHKHAPNEKVDQGETKDQLTCGKLCHIDGNCNSFSYQPGTRMCTGCSTLHCGEEYSDSSEDSVETIFFSTMEEPSGPATAMRLTGGKHAYEGRLEVQYNGQWGTVCNNSFDMEEANVVCNNVLNVLNGTWAGKIVPGAHFSQRTLQILLDNVSCSGPEKNLLECSHRAWGESACSHGGDVGISCNRVRLINGDYTNMYTGRLEVQYNGQWGTVCSDSFGLEEAMVACTMLNLPWVSVNMFDWEDIRYYPSTLPILLDDVSCSGSEESLFECSHRAWGESNCSHGVAVGISCAPNLHIHLGGSSASNNGLLEVSLDGIQWGTVCRNYFNANFNAAKVVCRMLGYPTEGASSSHVGYPVPGPMFLDTVVCTGSELSLLSCYNAGWGVEDCDPAEAVTVFCPEKAS